MSKLSLPELSMEAISYQGRSLLLFDVVSAIETFRNDVSLVDYYKSEARQGWDYEKKETNVEFDRVMNPKIETAFDRLNLSAVLAKRTGMSVTFVLADEYECWATPPLLDANNPFFKRLKSASLLDGRGSILERYHRIVRLAQDTQAWVDLKAGRVEGVFSNLNCRVILGARLLLDNNFTSEEVAAMILHEVGHIFSFFETLGYTTASNMVVQTAAEALADQSDQSVRLKILSQATSVFGAKPSKELLDAEDDASVKVLLLRTIEDAQQSRVQKMAVAGESAYNVRSIEFMADQYVVRMGASVPLASAYHKMAKINVPDYGRSRIGFFAMQSARMTLLAATFAIPGAGLIIGPVLTTIATTLLAIQAKNEDGTADPGERLGAVAQDLIQLLKDRKIEKNTRQQILDDLELVNELREQVKEHHGIVRFLYRNVLPSGRRQAKIRDLQKGIEELVNNNLFAQAARFGAMNRK